MPEANEIPERSQVSTADTWELSTIYSSLEGWRAELNSVEQDLPKISAYQGRLGESAETLNSAFRQYLSSMRQLEKAYTYAHLLSDEDTSNSTHRGYLEEATNLYTRMAATASYVTPELLCIDDKLLQSYLDQDLLADLRRMITEIVRYKPHTLTPSEELLLARATEVFMTPENVFGQMNNADLTFGTITVDGKKIPLSHGSYVSFLKNPNRDVRQNTYSQYMGVYDAHKNSISAALSGSVKKDVYLATIKNHRSARSRALFSDNVDLAVYDNLIETVSKNLSPLHDYYELRRVTLGLDSLSIYDTYTPLVSDISTSHSFDEASSIICDALAPLGKDYLGVLKAGLGEKRWVDRYENRGKRSGGYSSGSFDTDPYILMNYTDTELGDMFTLAHEAGHSMHSYYSRKHQPYQDHSYTIFVAEVASTFNEQLLTRHLREIYKDDQKMVSFLINQLIDDIKATLFRQTMFAEFELKTHQLAENNEPLTLNAYRSLYGELLRKYFGPAVKIEEIDELEFLRIPHFYSAFYVYKYATGIAAAYCLTEKVLGGSDTDLQHYLDFLKSGCSKYPLELLKDAGVDMTSPEPIQSVLDNFQRLVDELKTFNLGA